VIVADVKLPEGKIVARSRAHTDELWPVDDGRGIGTPGLASGCELRPNAMQIAFEAVLRIDPIQARVTDDVRFPQLGSHQAARISRNGEIWD